MTNRYISFISISLVLSACSSVKITDANNGSSKEKAIKIKNTRLEHVAVAKLCPECTIVSTSMITNESEGKIYDSVVAQKPNGQEIDYYFDVTEIHQ